MSFNRWKSSAEKIKSTRYLAIMAMTISLKIILSYFRIPLGENLRMSMSFLIVASEGLIFGPALGTIDGIVSDLLGFMLNPGGVFYVGYTLTAILGQWIYGFFFYEKKVTLKRIILAKIVVNYLLNAGLGSFWSSRLYGKAYLYYAAKSLVKNTLLLPVEIAAIYLLFKTLIPYLKKRGII